MTLNRERTMKTTKLITLTTLAALLLPCIGIAQAQQPSIPERVAALKASLEASQIIIKQYEWIQTNVITLKGDEKSRQQERCYYGADGGLQKIALAPPAPEKTVRGPLRRAIVANKKEELTDYMKSAVALVKTYVPPSPMNIQAAKEAGKVSIAMLQPGKRARLDFRDYQRPGDNLGVEVDLVNNRALGVKVSTYLDDAKAVVTLDVSMGQLNDGTTHASNITLDAKAKNLKVTVQNSGYRKTNQ